MAELFFEDCEVPVENRLGREGNGKNLFTHSMTWERSCILASAVGAMQRLLETSIALRAGAPAVRPADRQVPAGRQPRSST